MRAVIYVRVSLDEQAKEGYSVTAQKALLLRWLHERGHDLVDEYIDAGHSGKNLNRPAIQRLMKNMPNRKFDLIIFWRMNRLTRSVKDKITLFEMFDKYKIDMISMTEEIDTTTAAGRMTSNILMSVAQGEREQTSENVHGTMYERAMKGLRNGAVAPYGYNLVDKQLVINDEEAEVVKRIYKIYQDNRSFLFIAKQFTKEGISKRGNTKWSDFSVGYILSNPVYCGKLRWNYRKLAGARTGKEIIVDSTHDAIISPEEYDLVEKMRARRATEGKKITSDYPFTSTVRCARCGYGLIGSSRKRVHDVQRHYKCLGRFHFGICNMPVIAEKAIEKAFLSSLKSIRNINKLISLREPVEVRQDIVAQLQKELDAIQKRQKKFQLAYANDAMTLEELKAHKEDDRARETFIRKELEHTPTKDKSQWTKDEIVKQLVGLPDLWELADDKDKKIFMNDVFDKIVIDTESVVSSKSGSKFIAEVIIKQFSLRT